MPQLARYLQINTARDATPTKYDYALVMNGEDIETQPTYGEVQPKKNVTLFGTHDEKDFGSVGNPPAIRTFEVIPGSHHVLEASGRKLENVKAVLVVNAICTAAPEPNFYAQVEAAGKEIGPMFAQHDGLIVKHFLCSAWGDKDIGGGLYFFETKEQAEAYLASEFWEKVLVDTEWDKDSITYELYSVNGYAMAA